MQTHNYLVQSLYIKTVVKRNTSMISAWLRRRKSIKTAAAGLYQAAVIQSRDPRFYTELGVSDTIDGRFDLVSLHVFLIVQRLSRMGSKGKALSQALFDHMFTHMEQTLREIGIGDMGVPKHMKRMMHGFNGRVHSYHTAIDNNDMQELQLAVTRNIYRVEGDSIPDEAGLMVEYITQEVGFLMQQDYDTLAAGRVRFHSIPIEKKRAHA